MGRILVTSNERSPRHTVNGRYPIDSSIFTRRRTAAKRRNYRSSCPELPKATEHRRRPGEGFGARGRGFARLTLATADEGLDEGLHRLRQAFGAE